jgi:hypothetical protein
MPALAIAAIAVITLLSTGSSSSRYTVVKTGEFFTITGPAKIVHPFGGERLLIATDKDTFNIPWTLAQCSTQVRLENDSVYTFVFTRELRVRHTISILTKVEEHGITIYDREICPIHQRRMSMEMARIKYGLLFHGDDEPSFYAVSCLFPNRRRPFVEGGCVVIAGQSPDSTGVLVCSQCDSAYAKWTRDNPVRK